MTLNRNAMLSPAALVDGGGRKTAAARSSGGGGPLVPGSPTYTPPVLERGSDGTAYRRVNIGGSEVIIRGNAAGGVKRKAVTDEDRMEFARIRKTAGGDVLMVPKVVGQGLINAEAEWAAITDNERQQRFRVFKQCKMEAASLVWQGERLPDWMLWEEGKEYDPPAQFLHGIEPAEDVPAVTKSGYDVPLIKTGDHADPGPLAGATQTQQAVGQSYEHNATTAALQQRISQLENQITQLQTRAASAFTPRKAVIEVPGFGEVETTIDWYAVAGDVLTIAYDSSKQRNILSPKPAEGKAVAQFILELIDGDQKHIFELVAAYQSRVEFPAAGSGGATFQQFMISRHETVSA